MSVAFKPRQVLIPSVLVDRSKFVRYVAWLILLYIALLMFEGALRKWTLPRFSNPLLIIRDPILILIYIMALRARVFPCNRWVISLAIIGILSEIVSVCILLPYFPWTPLAAVTLYGFRSNFLHLPLIFIMANVFDERDVKRIGWWVLLGMIPLSLLMVAQFQASPDSFINRTAGSLAEGGEQLTAGSGRIRPAGPFSFISGPIFYCSAAAAFLIYGILTRATYKIWVLIASGVALVVAVAVSGSRACVASVLLVVLSILVVLIVRPQAVNQIGRILLVGIIAAYVIARLPVFKEGVDVLSTRFTSAAEESEHTLVGGMLNRVAEEFTESLTNLDKFPAGGWGLGLGTNAGAHFLIGTSVFLLSENEWTRVLYESGPFLGMAFLLWRTILTFHLGYLSLIALKRGATLPILLFSCGSVILLTGQFGQPTTLGFAVVLCGLCLAATRGRENTSVDSIIPANGAERLMPRRIPRRSEYASRLHGPNP